MRGADLWTAAALATTVAAFLLRCFHLDREVHVDAVAHWYDRTARFWEALSTGAFDSTYQSPHPGVMLMWLSGASLRAFGVEDLGIDHRMLFAAKIPSVCVSTASVFGAYHLTRRLLGPNSERLALLFSVLLAAGPVSIFAARLYHLEGISTSLALLGTLAALVSARELDVRVGIVTGVLWAGALLTRTSVAPMLALAGLMLLARIWIPTPDGRVRFQFDKRAWHCALAVGIACLVTYVLLWPAMWVQPLETLVRMTETSVHWAGRGHKHFVDGHITKDPGAWYYLRMMARSFPPTTLVVAGLGLLVLPLRPAIRWPCLALIACLLAYGTAIALVPKKLSRYGYPFYFICPFLAAVGFDTLLEGLHRGLQRVMRKQLAGTLVIAALALLSAAHVARAASNYPTMRYCSGWLLKCRTGAPNHAVYAELGRRLRRHWKGDPREVSVYSPKKSFVTMHPWFPAARTPSPKQAQYLVLHAGHMELRHGKRRPGAYWLTRWRRYLERKPAFVVSLEGKPVAWVWLGPMHPDYVDLPKWAHKKDAVPPERQKKARGNAE